MDSKTLIDKYEKMITSTDTYTLDADMDIVSNEEVYHYKVTVDYMKGDYYKVDLTNKDNEHKQIILKNEKGVFVVTPDLNKSFKFQSQWPNNSSQSYILSSLLKDLRNDENVKFEETENNYILTSTVNYPNNSSLVSQKITFDKDVKVQKVEVFNENENANITLKVIDIKYNTNFDEKHFEIDSIIKNDTKTNEVTNKQDEAANKQDENVSKLDEIIYPMYLPTGTTFKGEETVKTDDSERVILSFTGDKSFIMIEEVSKVPGEFEVSNTDGELVFYENILGSLTDTSLNWTANGKDYYIIAENLSNEELLKVASSTGTVSLTK